MQPIARWKRLLLCAGGAGLFVACATLGRNVSGYTGIHFTGTKVAEADPLKVCLNTPAACDPAPRLSCSMQWVEAPEPSYETVNCTKPSDHPGNVGGTYDMVFSVQCYEPITRQVKLNEPWTGGFEIPAPQPYRRFLSSDTQVGLFPKGLGGWSRTRPLKDWVEAPAATEIEVLREWPLEGGSQCNHVVARVVDADDVLSSGTLVIVSKKSLSETAPAGVSVADRVAQKTADAEAEKEALERRRAELAARTEQEVRTGRCSDERRENLRSALQNLKNVFGLMRTNRQPEFFDLVGHEFAVATDKGTTVPLRLGARGEYQFFALSYTPVQMELRDKTGGLVRARPMYEGLAKQVIEYTDSALLEANSGENVTVRLKGGGCGLIAVFRKL